MSTAHLLMRGSYWFSAIALAFLVVEVIVVVITLVVLCCSHNNHGHPSNSSPAQHVEVEVVEEKVIVEMQAVNPDQVHLEVDPTQGQNVTPAYGNQAQYGIPA